MVGIMKPIRLESRPSTQDANGRWIAGTILKYNVWAEVTKDGSSRNVNNGQTQLSNSITLKIWFNDSLNTNWKIVYAGKRYTITGLDRVNEMRFNTLIKATEVGNN
jgi:SPP1 family predicted phage head-tail adaptor